MSYLYLLFSGFSLTNITGVILSWIILPILIILKISSKKIKIKSTYFTLSTLLFLLIIFSTIIPYFFGEYTTRLYSNFYLSTVGLFISLLFFSCNDINKKNITSAINLVLLINISAFYIQFVSYYVFEYTLDYNYITGGLGGRFYWGEVFRASGLFDEPAVYSLHIVCLIVSTFLLQKKTNILIYTSIASLFLSFSFIAIFQGILLLILLTKNKKYLIISLLLSVAILIIFQDNILLRYNEFLLGNDGSNNTKIQTIVGLINSNKWLIGYGLVGYHSSFPLYYQGLYDLTFWGANISLLGLPLGLAVNIFSFLYILKFSKKEFLLINIVLLKLSVPTYSIYWFFIFFLIWYKRNKRYRN
ncbi:hypothetical protein [Xenorhabdus bovienii]|uniref:hypothetical protein n=1 Tax=Xenorhabdus bovienii TaxID=40576 RepID=UPI0023B331B0|nr:hypothetical protein [Xenorhabdus bovienii]MDE9486657.1 hypothetical protein [Xenorhabdus bovienii]